MPELINIATGRQARPPELDKFAAIFAIAGEKQETVADQKTVIFLKRFLPNPDVGLVLIVGPLPLKDCEVALGPAQALQLKP
jgi:hypothetical protein